MGELGEGEDEGGARATHCVRHEIEAHAPERHSGGEQERGYALPRRACCWRRGGKWLPTHQQRSATEHDAKGTDDHSWEQIRWPDGEQGSCWRRATLGD